MEEDDRCIGARISELRDLSGFSQEEISKAVDLTLEKYKSYESGEKDIPASVLKKIAQEFKVELGVLLTGEDSRMNIFYVNRKNRNHSIERRNQYKYEPLGEKFVGKRCEIFLMTVVPLPEGEKLSIKSHEGQEFNYVLEGSFKLHIHNHEIILNEGDSVFFDSSYEHGMEALSDKEAKFLAIVL